MRSYMNMPDDRPLDDWGKRIGKRYEDKDWDRLTPKERMADFDWKEDILTEYGEEVSWATFYQDYLFCELYEGHLEEGFKILLKEYKEDVVDAPKKKTVHKIDIEDMEKYLHLNNVAVSPCLFFQNWPNKKLLCYLSAFVLDVDKVRPKHLQRFLYLMEEKRILEPTFIANSGSGIHFYYVMDKMLRCDFQKNTANRQIAENIYKKLYQDIRKKENWPDAQIHWLGQDYRVVNSRTKFDQIARIYKIGKVYSIEELMNFCGVTNSSQQYYATPAMVAYASSIAKDLKLKAPDYTDAKATYAFVAEHKDEAYKFRVQRRQQKVARLAAKRKKKKDQPKNLGTWYKKTFNYLKDNAKAGYRYSSMKALAIIAFKEGVPREEFVKDIASLAAIWESRDWNGDKFNQKNVASIIRFFDTAERYGKASSETLEEWLGYTFSRIGTKRNDRKQKEHLHADLWVNEKGRPITNPCKQNRELALKYMRENGEIKGRPSGSGEKKQQVQEWRAAHPDGKKADCIRQTGLSKPTVYKWWNSGKGEQAGLYQES